MRHGLKQSIIDDSYGHQLRVIDLAATDECHKCLCTCILVIGRYCWHLVCSTSFCNAFVCLFCKNRSNRRCCVKYTRILLFLVFYNSQGRRAFVHSMLTLISTVFQEFGRCRCRYRLLDLQCLARDAFVRTNRRSIAMML